MCQLTCGLYEQWLEWKRQKEESELAEELELQKELKELTEDVRDVRDSDWSFAVEFEEQVQPPCALLEPVHDQRI